MRTASQPFVFPAIVAGLISLTLSACGGDSDDAASTAAATVADTSPSTDAPPPVTPDSTTPTSDPASVPPTAAPTDPPVTEPAGPTVISVTIGTDSSPDRVETVALGTEVTLQITNPAAADEFHLHGYDLGDGQEVPAGVTASFTFVADQAGTFELESHESDDVLVIIEVA